jgi:NAD(P)-dependent dehydrogenase (short-subunit alcohol dehydrogenase family)
VSRETAESTTLGLDLRGRRALVTGASSGLGRECARVLALRGAHVLVAARTEEKAAAGEIGGVAARYDGDDLAAVRGLAERIAREGPLDWLFLNAGTFGQRFRLTPEGHEATMAGNYLGHFVLVHRLAALGGLAPGARIVGTLSEGVLGPFARADLAMVEAPAKERFRKLFSSPDSKVLLSLLLVEAERRTGLRAVGVMPPATRTNNVDTGGPVLRALAKIVAPLLFSSVEEGARSMVWAATIPELPDGARCFTHALRPRSLPDRATDPEAARRAWDVTERVLGLA